MGSGAAAVLGLKPACERCGSASNLYGTGCRHATVCSSCGAAMARSRARCAVCAAPITNLIREYSVRFDTTTEKNLSIGRFTTGLPPFSKEKNAGNKWSLRKDGLQGRQLTGNMREKYDSKRPWILEDETGEYQYQSQLEGSQSATATYYLLMMHGREFHAVPVGSWHNFSKTAQYKQLTLEEAEERMNRRKNNASGHERWMVKAATNGASAFSSDMKKLDDVNGEAASGVHSKKGNGDEDGNQSDKGEEEEEEGAARKNKHGLTTKRMEEEEGGKDFDLDGEIEKGDDWEHEEIFTDDDEALDIDPEERANLADPESPAPPDIKMDDNDNEQGAGGLSKSGKELKRLLRRAAGQNDSDVDDAEDTDEDEPPSPVFAQKQKDQLKTESGGNTPAKPITPGLANSTPPATISNQKRRSGGDDARTSNGAAPKKLKIEPETETLVVKEETPSSLEPISKAFTSARSDAKISPVTEEEIRRVLLSFAPVTTQDLVSRFRPRIRTSEDKNEFIAILKKISHVCKNNGRNYIVLKEEYK